MMKRLSIFIWGIFFLFLTNSAAEQRITINFDKATSAYQEHLAAAGLENIQILLAPNQTIWITFENRRYRSQVTALGIVLNYAAECFPFAREYVILPKYRNVILKYISVNREHYVQFIRNEITAAEFFKCLTVSYQTTSERPFAGYRSIDFSPSFYKFDIAFSPGWKAQFAQSNDPAQLQFNFLADFSFTLATGMQIEGQFIAPIYNEFHRQEGKSRLGQLHFNQLFRLPQRTFFSLSAGMFEYDCFGVSSQIKRFLWHDRLSFLLRFDWLQTRSLHHWLPLNYPCDNRFCHLVQAEYLFEPIDFRARVTWGRYLLGDIGWRIDILRRFHELELGFMGVWNKSLEFLTGMTIRLPFPVSKQAQPGRVRLRTPDYLSWNYRYLPCFDGLILHNGESFEAITDQLSKSFIRANINQLKTAIRYVKLNKPDVNNKLLAGRGN